MKLKHRIMFMLFAASVIMALGLGAAKAAPMCIPGLSGTTAPFSPRIVEGKNGTHIYWWCAKDGSTYDAGFSCAECDYAKFGTVLASITTKTKANAAYAEHVKFECSDKPQNMMCIERTAIYNANRDTWLAGLVQPPVAIWRVKGNGVDPSGIPRGRPARELKNGVLSLVDDKLLRAPPLALCDLTKPTAPATSGDIRAQWIGGPDGFVTICEKGSK